MSVAAQIQAKMAEIAWPVLCLSLGTQYDFIQQLFVLRADGFGKDAVELPRSVEGCLGRVNPDAGEKLAQRHQLFGRWRVMHAIDQRRLFLLKGFGRGDICLNHELFDKPVSL